MSLSIYDPIKGCFVLKPEQPPIINAFHPDYVKTHMPEFLSSIRIEAKMKANGENVAKTTPMKMHPIRPAHLHRPNLAPTDFHIYQKAGMPKGTKKCQKENP